MVLLPGDGVEAPAQRLVWSTDPGIRYTLQVSDDLNDPLAWDTVEGFPTEAEALAQQHQIEHTAGDHLFYRVVVLDEQPPSITSRNPGDGAFGVSRFGSLIIKLEDVTGLNPDSIQLTIGTHGPFTLSNTELSLSNGILTFDLGGDTALGAYGETLPATLVVADTLGNSTTLQWAFVLELESTVADNILVFGSPTAQRAGQRLNPEATRIVSAFNPGPVRMGDVNTVWSIQEVLPEQVLISYEGTAPSFTVGQLITNLAPTHETEIFYRRIDAINNDAVNQVITLQTTELPLSSFLTEGSFNLTEATAILNDDGTGTLTRALELSLDKALPEIGGDFSGQTLLENDNVTVTLTEGVFLFQPSIKTSLEFGFGGLKRFEAQASGDLQVACVPFILVLTTHSGAFEKELWEDVYWLWSSVAGVPIGVRVEALVLAQGQLNVSLGGTLQAGYRQSANLGIAGSYIKDDIPSVQWNRWYRTDRTSVQPFSYDVEGLANGSVQLVPSLDIRLYGAAGAELSLNPRLEFDGMAEIQDGQVTQADWSLSAIADVNAHMSVTGIDDADLPTMDSFELYRREWVSKVDSNTTPTAAPSIIRQPNSQEVQVGESAKFSVEAMSDGPIRYQWHHQGILLPNQTQSELHIQSVATGSLGAYYCAVTSNGQTVNSETAFLNVEAKGVTLATHFQYPIGTRNIIPEFPLNQGINEENDFYPDHPEGDKDIRGSAGGATNVWANKQDVGAYHPDFGALHPGEDWNLGGGSDDIGQSVYPIAAGRVVQIEPTKSGAIQEQGWRIVVEHVLDGSIRKPSDSPRYYSIYVHVTSDPTGSIPLSAAGFPIKVDKNVDMETPIAYIANLVSTDFSPHLHLELRRAVRDLGPGVNPWSTSRGGYYSNLLKEKLIVMGEPEVRVAFDLMKAEGIIDPSDFIDRHITPVVPVAPSPTGFSLIPAGTFIMGSPEDERGRAADETQHQVTLTRSFYLQRTEVTWAQWNEVRNWAIDHGYTDLPTGQKGSHGDDRNSDQDPVTYVSWYDAVKWLNAWSEKEGLQAVYSVSGDVYRTGQSSPTINFTANGYRLPTESEWEYAARAGTTTAFYTGAITYTGTSPVDPALDLAGWYGGNSDTGDGEKTHPVGQKQANAWGLYDMHGNIWEWCSDWNETYPGTVTDPTDPTGPSSGTLRVLRGGSWSRSARNCRAANRDGHFPAFRFLNYGFRPARSSVP